MPSETTQPALFEDLRSLLAETFKMDPAEIGPEAQLGELPQWDSMGHMDLMVGLETRFGVEINAENISQLTSVPAILAHIKTKSHA
ncbi:MAG: acyl carrier protein [Anaerolineales bacterium]